MNRRAANGPQAMSQCVQTLAIAASTAALLIAVGCGGGGGGGNNGNGGGGQTGTGDCGDQLGNGTTVVCGYVIRSSDSLGQNGATVQLKSNAGTKLASTTTQHNSQTNADGFYKLNVPTGSSLLEVDVPAGDPNFDANFLQFNGAVYFFGPGAAPAKGGGECIPALILNKPGADNKEPDVTLFNSGPPPPPFGCPR